MPLDGGVQSPPRASSGLEMAWPSPRAAPTSWVGSLSTCTRLTANSLPVQHASTSRRTPRPSDRKSAATGGPTGFWQSTLDRGKHEDHNEMAKGDRDGQDRKSGAAGHATAAINQTVAVVVRPRTISLRTKMRPPPMKPIPDTICAAIREGPSTTRPDSRTLVKPYLETNITSADEKPTSV